MGDNVVACDARRLKNSSCRAGFETIAQYRQDLLRDPVRIKRPGEEGEKRQVAEIQQLLQKRLKTPKTNEKS